jgi:DNA topoisomerase-1
MFSTDPIESAAEAGLRYVSSGGPCIRRLRSGRAFRYIGTDGKPLRDPKPLERIRSLVIPPAWRDVWICPTANGHLQAVGRDAKGRKQYRYHPRYRATRDQAKFSRMIAFGTVLALIRKRVKEDLQLTGLPKEKVLAAVVRLLATSLIRVGNEEYAQQNDSFGLTTLKNRHVRIDGARLLFRFRGKSGQEHTIELTDRRLARIVKSCRELPGYELFQYVTEGGEPQVVDAADVNAYLRDTTGQDFTAKDFRTWFGTILAIREFRAASKPRTVTTAKRAVVDVVKRVAGQLGNRPATCRKYYIHPAVIDAYADGSLPGILEQGEEQNAAYAGLGLSPEEYCVMVIVAKYQENLARDTKAKAA